MATSKIVAVSRSIRGLLIEQCRNEDDESHAAHFFREFVSRLAPKCGDEVNSFVCVSVSEVLPLGSDIRAYRFKSIAAAL